MSDTLTVAIIAGAATIAVPLFTLLGVLLERRVRHKTADAAITTANAAKDQAGAALTQAKAALEAARASALAAETNAETAKDEAGAEMRKAVVAEREQASADWSRYCDAQQHWNEVLAAQVADNSRRLAEAEMRSAAAELRATKAETLYSLAITYLHSVASWVTEHWPGENLPPPPPELLADLGGYFHPHTGGRGQHHRPGD